MKKTVLAAVVLVVAITATMVYSQGSGRPGAGVPGPPGVPGAMQITCPVMALMPLQPGMIERFAEQLELTEDQISKLRAHIQKCEETNRPLMEKAAEANKALREALFATDYSAQKVKELAATAEKAEGAILEARIGQWTQTRTILTTEQIQKLQQLMARPRMGGGPPGPMPGPPPMPAPPPPPEQ